MIDVNQDFWLMSGITGIVAAQYFWINDRNGWRSQWVDATPTRNRVPGSLPQKAIWS